MNNGDFFDITEDRERILAFQTMLRLISEADDRLPTVSVDGVFGDGMENATKEFQRFYGLPVTGVVDYDTWERAAEEYERLVDELAPPKMISPFPHIRDYTIKKGERSDLVLILQIMLSSLHILYDETENVVLSGVYDSRTDAAVKRFQVRNLITPNGYVDKETWDRMARQYNLSVHGEG